MPSNIAANKRSYADYLGFVAAEGGVPAKPANTVAPTITGTPTVGQTLTGVKGTWTGTGTPTYTYKWLADAVEIAGATGLTYVLTAAEEGAVIVFRVTGANAVGSVSADSAATSAVAP